MKWSELEAIWRRQKEAGPGLAGLADPTHDFEAKSRRRAASLFWRDVREASACLIVAAVFAYLGWQGGRAYWPLGLCVVLTLGLMAFFIRERIRVHRLRPGRGATLLTKVNADIAELQHQRQLLWNVTGWYLAPLAVAEFILLGTVVFNKLDRLHSAKAQLALAGVVVLLVVLFWGVRALNHWAVRRAIDPWLIELKRTREDLLSPE